MQINEITLEDMLPQVFINEKIPASEVWNTRLSFRKGNRYRIEAASGGGKSSLCSYIFGTRTDYKGTLYFNNTDIKSLSIPLWQDIRRKNIAYLPQELSLFPELTAWENIQLNNSLTGYADNAKIEQWLDRIGISARKDYPVGKMSIGQQQRVAIIRSICQPFDFILLDEPVSHLDAENNRIATEIIEEEASKNGAGIISTSVGNPLQLSDPVILSL